MSTSLLIGGDPVTWFLAEVTIDDAVRRITESSDAHAFPIIGPLKGRLVLAPRALETAALLGPPDHGWIPSGGDQPTSILYVPSPSGLTADYPGYALPDGTDLDALERDITRAMNKGGKVTVNVREGGADGVLVLNGDLVPFVVICPGTRQG